MKTLRQLLRVTVATLGVASTLGSGVGRAQKPDPGLKGEPMSDTWGFSAAGARVTADGSAATPVAVVGLITFDPLTRDCVIVDRINAGGTSAPRTSDLCTYSLLPEGRGSFVALFPGDTDFTPYQFVLVDREREMRLIRTDSTVMEGVAKPQ